MARFRARQRPTVSNLTLFSGLDKEQRANVDRLGTPAQIEPGQVLIYQGRPGTEFFVVLSGFAVCLTDGRIVARFGAGDFFGEMALLDGGPRTATVAAVTPMEVLVFTPGEFTALVQASGEVAHRVLKQLAGRLRAASAA